MIPILMKVSAGVITTIGFVVTTITLIVFCIFVSIYLHASPNTQFGTDGKAVPVNDSHPFPLFGISTGNLVWLRFDDDWRNRADQSSFSLCTNSSGIQFFLDNGG